MTQKTIDAIKAQAETLSGPDLKAYIETLKADPRKGVQKICQAYDRARMREAQERARLEGLWTYEDQARAQGYLRIAGTDEAGRGPLAGPVVAAAVVLPRDCDLQGINDSKKLSRSKREALYDEIISQADSFALVAVSAEAIDQTNILRASERAMAKALEKLGSVSLALVDGDCHPPIPIPQKNLIGGDRLSISIAAASILAKVWRDRHMEDLDRQYPGYGFADHKGYGTPAHYRALKDLGPSPVHRKTFRLTSP